MILQYSIPYLGAMRRSSVAIISKTPVGRTLCTCAMGEAAWILAKISEDMIGGGHCEEVAEGEEEAGDEARGVGKPEFENRTSLKCRLRTSRSWG